MILKNFNITYSFTEIIFDDKLYDLHNCYEWIDTRPNEKSRSLELKFKRRSEDYIDPTTAEKFSLKFNNVKTLEAQDHDSDYPSEYLRKEGTTVDMLGFSNFDIPIDGISPEIKATEGLDCLSVITVTGKAIRICADSAEIVLEN